MRGVQLGRTPKEEEDKSERICSPFTGSRAFPTLLLGKNIRISFKIAKLKS